MPWDRNDKNNWGRVPEGERQFMSLGAMLAVVGMAVVGLAVCCGLVLNGWLPQ
jgi:hypothetical protein